MKAQRRSASQNFGRRARLNGFVPVVLRLRAYDTRQVEASHGRTGTGFFHQFACIFFNRRKYAAHDAFVAKVTHNRTRVEIRYDRDIRFRKKRAGLRIRAPVAGDARELADDQPFDIRLARFAVGGAGAVIADLRIGENDDLSGIGGIREDFLVTGDGGIEDDFAAALGGRTKTPALEDRSVFQGQDCRI
jgi:hypothetical protein